MDKEAFEYVNMKCDSYNLDLDNILLSLLFIIKSSLRWFIKLTD